MAFLPKASELGYFGIKRKKKDLLILFTLENTQTI